MSCRAGVSVSRVTYSVRNCWSTEMPCRYSRVAPSGMPSVVTTKAARKVTAPATRPRGVRAATASPPRKRYQTDELADGGQRVQLIRRREGRPVHPADRDQGDHREHGGEHRRQHHVAAHACRADKHRRHIRWAACGRSAAGRGAAPSSRSGTRRAPRPGPCPCRRRGDRQFATYSLLTVSGASLTCALNRVRTCPGRITMTRTPNSRNASPRPR